MPLNPAKLLHSKWTAVNPVAKEKHFLVVRIIDPEAAPERIECVEMEAVYTGRRFILPWRDLTVAGKWRRGWQPIAAGDRPPD